MEYNHVVVNGESIIDLRGDTVTPDTLLHGVSAHNSAGEEIIGGLIESSIAVGTTTTGAAGTNAAVTNSGTTSNVVLNFTIPRGNQGEQGPQGVQGIQGVKGDDGEDGFSPSASVNKSGTTTTISITDKSGTTSATINDGSLTTLNGMQTQTPSFYAPTTAGTDGYILESNGSGAPSWKAKQNIETMRVQNTKASLSLSATAKKIAFSGVITHYNSALRALELTSAGYVKTNRAGVLIIAGQVHTANMTDNDGLTLAWSRDRSGTAESGYVTITRASAGNNSALLPMTSVLCQSGDLFTLQVANSSGTRGQADVSTGTRMDVIFIGA